MGGSQRPSDKQLNGAVGITLQDLQWAMSAVKPSAMREVAVDVPKVIAPLSIGFRVVPTSNGSFRGPLGHSPIPEMDSSKFLWRKWGEKRAVCSYFGSESKRQEAKLETHGFPGLEK